ncbi:hypothetical protein OnM2_006019 [Erysiphe neolycopersici]|uniref:Uncharacterized protein n=1 Tax=Erysiphe neolycopersici TaxID=212602 RepID=A0A420I714_9PEZI|nr:hypothetical protein OnM2_006019 [Erysiphe neolycopersici]
MHSTPPKIPIAAYCTNSYNRGYNVVSIAQGSNKYSACNTWMCKRGGKIKDRKYLH